MHGCLVQDSPTENPYLSAISSHFSYWTSPDTALLLARAVSGLDVLTGRAKGSRDHKDEVNMDQRLCRM